MTLKVALIGSQYIGKTVYCEELLEHFSQIGFNVMILEEVVRECPPSLINEMGTLKAQDWILDNQKKREEELTEKDDIYLLDRCVLDNFAYWQRVALLKNVSKDVIKKKMVAVFEHSKQYDVILFIQPFDTEKIEPDGFRSTSLDWRNEMHDAVYNIISQFSRRFLIQRIKALLRNRGFIIQGIKALLRDRRFLIQRTKVLLRKDRYNTSIFLLMGSKEEVFEQAKDVIETHLALR